MGKGLLLAASGSVNYVRGQLLTNPATRTVYKTIMKDAAEGSFKNMSANFAKLESEIANEFGSVDDFFKSAIEELEIANFD
jgi:superoxide dismutase